MKIEFKTVLDIECENCLKQANVKITIADITWLCEDCLELLKSMIEDIESR